MHLKQLKLAGFKSFVDPTVAYFPSQLVAVVGPNGCGKSNIIDAVRWVMGESSAKNLRGESMVDVIFNGSVNRKSVGQASVELVFDNSLGRLAGPFASYGEIAVKRVVTRDGDSSYYLNGSKCRRKDITDIFLGTGAGARGYSIIGQGTISRIIEAKPEELRAHFEEAAGVSKYKERRKETLLRMDHTRENLTRVADIKEELDKQLQRLERQAKSAERYLQLKQEEQLYRAEILSFKWQDFTNQQLMKQKELQSLNLDYEQKQSLAASSYKTRVILNDNLQNANEQLQHTQESMYQLGTEIVRLEESIQQQEKEKNRLTQDKQQLQEESQLVQSRLNQDKEEQLFCQQQAEEAHIELEQLKIEFSEAELRYQSSQKEQRLWEGNWQQILLEAQTLKSDLQLNQIQLEHLNQKQQSTQVQLEKFSMEQAAICLADLNQAKHDLEQKQVQLKELQTREEHQFTEGAERLKQLRIQLQETQQQLHQAQDQFHQLNSERSALIAAQNAARQGANLHKIDIKEWSTKSRLVDILKVEPEWQLACDMILNNALDAYVLEDFEELWPQWDSCELQGAHIVTMRKSLSDKQSWPRLVDKISGDLPATAHFLEHIYIAKDANDAKSRLSDLKDYESVVTPKGIWLGKGWVKCLAVQTKDEIGLLARQQKILDMEKIVQELEVQIHSSKTLRDQYQGELQQNLENQERNQFNLNSANESLRVNLLACAAKEKEIHQAQHQEHYLASQIDELQQRLEEFSFEHCAISEKQNHLEVLFHQSEISQRQYEQEKKERSTLLTEHNLQVDTFRHLVHQAELEYDREKTKVHQLKDRIQREQERLELVQKRLEHLLKQEEDDLLSPLKETLAERVTKHVTIEMELSLNRDTVNQFKKELELIEQAVLKQDVDIKTIQDAIGQTKMQEQALALRALSFVEALDELGMQASTVLNQLPEGITQNIREDELIVISEKIKRLGAINLAAIEEYDSESQRKQYLDEQYHDLSEALASLETAIEKMDNETRLRLENTFNEVNEFFKALFPRLFGGGRAQLELTGDNVLDAGILVMAQPPGKRNSTIHLLSGGEKAMTAVALVFALFQLNPSPFCMLDEVDAPLDDINVGRFCDLVKEMSQFVQFLFISHNKVTMELADHLIGVTMREPGVSRLVAVDVKQAVTME